LRKISKKSQVQKREKLKVKKQSVNKKKSQVEKITSVKTFTFHT
jgi:hypothetical protein